MILNYAIQRPSIDTALRQGLTPLCAKDGTSRAILRNHRSIDDNA